MKKKWILLVFVVFCFGFVNAEAKIKQVKDDFDGSSYYYIKDTKSVGFLGLKDQTLIFYLTSQNVKTVKFEIMTPSHLEFIDSKFNVKIDGILYEGDAVDKARSEKTGSILTANRSFALSNDMIQAVLKAEKITFRFYLDDGKYNETIEVSSKFLKEIKELYGNSNK